MTHYSGEHIAERIESELTAICAATQGTELNSRDGTAATRRIEYLLAIIAGMLAYAIWIFGTALKVSFWPL